MPLITGQWTSLPQSAFDELAPDGGPLHFRNTGATYRDPMTGQDTGLQVRSALSAQAAAHGWPLIGIYISASGGIAPHFAVHRSDFPSQSGPQDQRADALQIEMDAALESIYKSSQVIDDPTDPDFGQAVDSRNFWATTHFWTYRPDGLYAPRSGGFGDFFFRVSDAQAPGNWWQEL